MPFIRSISGLRATLDGSLSEEVVTNYCKAFSEILPAGPVIIGRDGRPSGEWIESLAAKVLSEAGRDVIIIGVVPTPTVQLMTEHSDAAGGIAITASHNPKEWNGLKFINSSGVFLNAEENGSLWNFTDNKNFSTKHSAGKIEYDNHALEKHIDKILSLPIFSSADLINKIASKKLRIVVDAVNASGSVVVPMLLKKLGCEVVELFCSGDGEFPHTPEPLPENLGQLADSVREHGADMGIAVDPDADRLVLIDSEAKPIGEERTISLAVDSAFMFKDLFGAYSNNAVVNHSTTRLVDDIALSYQGTVLRSPVGEINVVNKMKESNALIGGEGSGGVILPACHYGRDSLVGIALVLALMAARNQSLKEIVASYKTYSMLKYKQSFSGNLENIINHAVRIFPYGEALREDGLKVSFPRSWVQVRASNTEPIIRIISEAPTTEEAQSLITTIKSLC